jgi:hypothetical protein
VYLVGDDTVDGHPGRRVYGKGRHRHPVLAHLLVIITESGLAETDDGTFG